MKFIDRNKKLFRSKKFLIQGTGITMFSTLGLDFDVERKTK